MAMYNPLEHLTNALNATVVLQDTLASEAKKAVQEAQPPTTPQTGQQSNATR